MWSIFWLILPREFPCSFISFWCPHAFTFIFFSNRQIPPFLFFGPFPLPFWPLPRIWPSPGRGMCPAQCQAGQCRGGAAARPVPRRTSPCACTGPSRAATRWATGGHHGAVVADHRRRRRGTGTLCCCWGKPGMRSRTGLLLAEG